MTPNLSYFSVLFIYLFQIASKLTFLLPFIGAGTSATLQNPYFIYIVAQYSFNMPCCIYFPLAAIKESHSPEASVSKISTKLCCAFYVCLFCLYFSLKLLHQKPLWFFSGSFRRPSSIFFFNRHHKDFSCVCLCVRG